MSEIFLQIRQAQQGNAQALETLVRENDRLVWSVVKHFTGKGYENEDLYQIGCIGFIKAVKKFDFSKNVQFSTYAVPLIMGEIRKFMRDDGIVKVSRGIKELARKIWYTAGEIEKASGAPASLSEIAQKLDISCEEAAMAMAASAQPVSIFQPMGDSGENEITLLDTLESDGNFDEAIVDQMAVRNAAASLPPREQKIIFMRYYQNKTQSEVAKMLGISQVQVSRLEKKILSKLKQEIG